MSSDALLLLEENIWEGWHKDYESLSEFPDE